MAASVEEITRSQKVAKATKAAGAVREMHQKAPQAIEKYIANDRDANKLTIAELEAISVSEFNVVLKGTNKGAKVEMFESIVGERQWNPSGNADSVANPAQQQWVGRAVRKNFGGSVHDGSVTAHDVDQQLFTVAYADRDSEAVGLAELTDIVAAAERAAERAADPNQSSRTSRSTRSSDDL